ncbi:ABC-type transport system involved in cytochrome c biogenesis permease component [Prosthecobacter fusiformis]|uniref:ABC-type transport system involved in cytochrome c biogenesis permease component n=1 Tax=Prosthecobacter fusiformis TaxID=48464 RepID=A0A4R7SRR2_9BACT|nr:hypothetical protein [Prosthecobacter fusiformis]TDU81385.1 ABC-type transport system involved in cytochrome c biogenesis permease component [Prosthecobacter fusiformis]
MNTAPLPLLRDFSDRLSPMLVKELRHGLRTRAFTSLLTSFQVCMILITGSGVLGIPQEVISNIFWTVALVALLLALPLRGFGTLSGEVQGGTMDMLTLTSISSFRIVYGKWSALFSQTLLLSISLLPYMVARYHFGGVEIVREALALAAAVLASAIVSAAYVAFSSQRSLVLRLFLTAGILLALVPVTVFIFVMINDTGGDRVLVEFLTLSKLEQAGLLLGIPFLSAYAVFTFLALGASRIAPVSENHSTWKRLIHLVMLMLLMLAGFALSFHPDNSATIWAYFPSAVLTLLVGVDVLTEPMPRFPSVIQRLQSGGLPPAMGRFLYPGWASAVNYYILLGVMNLCILLVLWEKHSMHDFGEFIVMMSIVLASALVPVAIRLNKTNLFANWCVVHIVLGVIGILLTMFRGLSRAGEVGFLGVFTPVTGVFGSMNNYQHEDEILLATFAFSLCWLATAVVLARKESAVYQSLETEARLLSAPNPAAES